MTLSSTLSTAVVVGTRRTSPQLAEKVVYFNSPSPQSCPAHRDATEVLAQRVQDEGAQHCHDLGTGTQHPPDPRVGDLRDVNLDGDNTRFTELQHPLVTRRPALCHLAVIPCDQGKPKLGSPGELRLGVGT